MILNVTSGHPRVLLTKVGWRHGRSLGSEGGEAL